MGLTFALALAIASLLSLPLACWSADTGVLPQSPQIATPADIDQAKNYGISLGQSMLRSQLGIDTSDEGLDQDKNYGILLGESVLKSAFDIDLNSFNSLFRWSLQNSPLGDGTALNTAAFETQQVGIPDAMHYSMDFHLEEDDDLNNLSSAIHDIPFALSFHANARVPDENFHIQTKVFLPLSVKDEMRAETQMSLPSLAPDWMGNLLDMGGFDSPWALKSSYGNRMGINSWETGLGTQWLKVMDLNYELRFRFGEDAYEESQWLKLDTRF